MVNATMAQLLRDMQERIDLLERRLRRGSAPQPVAETPALPNRVTTYADGLRDVTATAWASLSAPVTASISAPSPMRVLVTLGAWMTATGGETRATVKASGALTVDPPAPGWGQVLYVSSTDGSGTVQRSRQMVVDIPAGLTTFEVVAYRGGAAGVNQVNYAVLEVTPIAWAGVPPIALLDRGTTTERDGRYGVPASEPEREALYGAKWYNTELDYEQTFYPAHVALGVSQSAGWYRTNHWKFDWWKPALINGVAERNGVGIVVAQDGNIVTVNVGLILPAGGPDTTCINNVLPRPVITNQFLSRDGVGTDQNMWVTLDGSLVVRRNSSTGVDTPFAATGSYVTRDPISL